MRLFQAKTEDLTALTHLGLLLWPDNEEAGLMAEFRDLLGRADCAFFLAMDGQTPAGFAQCQLRYDYVEGTQTSPVGYLEGIYVQPAYRGSGLSGALLTACEDWARTKGCREFASDCELDNEKSLGFHLRMGFAEASRIICFRKKLTH